MLKTKTTSRAVICVILIYVLTVELAHMVMFTRLLLASNGNMKTLSVSNALNLNQNISSRVDPGTTPGLQSGPADGGLRSC